MRPPSPQRALFFAAGLLALALIWFRPGPVLLLGGDSGIYARLARELAERPLSTWLELSLDGQPWFEHPPLALWLEALAFRAFGATVPVAVAVARAWASLALLLLAFAVPPERRPFAALGLVALPGFLYTSQVAMLEGPLTACLALGLWAVLRLTREGQAPRAAWLAFAVALTTGFWAKGPPALVLLGVLAGLVLVRRVPGRRAVGVAALGLAVLTLTVLAFEAARSLSGLGPFFSRYLVAQVATSFVQGRHHPDPSPFFYVRPLLDWYLPGLLAAVGVAVARWRGAWPRVPDDAWAGAWLWGGVVLGFSAATQKYQWYVHPGAVGAALLVGAVLALFPARRHALLARLLLAAAVAWPLVRLVPWDARLTPSERQVWAIQSTAAPPGEDRRVADCSELEAWASEHLMGFAWRAQRVGCGEASAFSWDGAALTPRR